MPGLTLNYIIKAQMHLGPLTDDDNNNMLKKKTPLFNKNCCCNVLVFFILKAFTDMHVKQMSTSLFF